jgi:hypothetical protein
MNFKIPILLIAFNRPETTRMVIDVIRQNRPERLFIAADGPREGIAGEEELCRATRKVILDAIDWDCDIKTLFRDKNLGCANAVQEALIWFFDQVEEGIILEDDCLPSQDFFLFAEGMLNEYRHDVKVKTICGTNFLFDKQKSLPDDYFFSHFPTIWGWASWRRVMKEINWDRKTLKVRNQPDIYLKTFKSNPKLALRLHEMVDQTLDGRLNTWDTIVAFNTISLNGLNIIPTKNLVTNIGVIGTNYFGSKHEFGLGQLIYPLNTLILKRKDLVINEKINKIYLDGLQSVMVYDRNIFNRIKKRVINLFRSYR